MSPARASMGGVGLLFVAIVCTMLLAVCQGCGASAVERNTSAATIARIGLDATAGGIEIACAEAELDAHPERLTPCLRAAEGHEAARAAWDVWVAAILIASTDDDESAVQIMLALASPVLELYGEIAELLQSLGVDVPPLPPVLGGEQ